MEYKSKEIKAGLFIFIGVITLGVFVFMLGDVKHILDERKEQIIIFDYTSGLEVGATVRYAGLDVGRVKSIGLSALPQDIGKDHIAVVTEIDPKISIKGDSRASIKTEGLMGAFYVDMRPGTRQGKILGPGEPLVGMASFEFEAVGDMVAEVVGQIKRFTDLTEVLIDDTRDTLDGLRVSLDHVDQVVTENRESTRATFDNLKRISEKLADTLDDTEGDFKTTLRNTREITDRTNKILRTKEFNLANMIDQTDRLTRELELFMKDNRPALTNLISTLETDSPEVTSGLRSAVANFDTTMQQSNAILVENRRNLLEMLKNLKQTSENLKAFTADVKRNPWKLVRKSDDLLPIAPEKTPAAGEKDSLRMQRLEKVPD